MPDGKNYSHCRSSQTEIQAEGLRSSEPLIPDNVSLGDRHEPLLSDFTLYRMEGAMGLRLSVGGEGIHNSVS
jgi:hypothetical protein